MSSIYCFSKHPISRRNEIFSWYKKQPISLARPLAIFVHEKHQHRNKIKTHRQRSFQWRWSISGGWISTESARSASSLPSVKFKHPYTTSKTSAYHFEPTLQLFCCHFNWYFNSIIIITNRNLKFMTLILMGSKKVFKPHSLKEITINFLKAMYVLKSWWLMHNIGWHVRIIANDSNCLSIPLPMWHN